MPELFHSSKMKCPRVIRVVLAAHLSLPVYVDEQTFSARVGMSQRCPKPEVTYSTTSSARASTVGGMVMSRAFAVFRLKTIKYLDACSTGRSAGLVPLKILSI
jgi:hypothetical protein